MTRDHVGVHGWWGRWRARAGSHRSEMSARTSGVQQPDMTSGPVSFTPCPDWWLQELTEATTEDGADCLRQGTMALECVLGLQNLPPHERAVLVLHDFEGFGLDEVAEILDMPQRTVGQLLCQGRAGLAPAVASSQAQPPLGVHAERCLLARYLQARERNDLVGLMSLLAPDALLLMPPQPPRHQGPRAVAECLGAMPGVKGRLRSIATRANGQPAFGHYLQSAPGRSAQPLMLEVLTLRGSQIAGIAWFGDRALFELFGLPTHIER